MTKNNEQVIECKYKFQSIEKFAGKPYCTLHNETCEFINFVCDKNCQVYEDYKQLKHKEQECEELKEYKEDLTQRLCDMNAHKTFEIVELKQTLAEIKEIITTALEQNTLINLNKILQKINEVTDEKEHK